MGLDWLPDSPEDLLYDLQVVFLDGVLLLQAHPEASSVQLDDLASNELT